MFQITDFTNKSHEEITKECYLFAEQNNWDAIKVEKNISLPFSKFKSLVQEYIKKNNIDPTVEKALFFMRNSENHKVIILNYQTTNI